MTGMLGGREVEDEEDEDTHSPLDSVDVTGGLSRGGVVWSVSAPIASGSAALAVVSVRLSASRAVLASGELMRAGLMCWRTDGDGEEGETGGSLFSIMI